MKEKNKSILKRLGVGALACFGVFAFAGCSSAEISQEQIDTIMETVEQSNQFMKDELDFLKQQNQELQEQNDNLEKLIEESKKMTKEEVWNFAQNADYNLINNKGGLRDNLVITYVVDNGVSSAYYFYNLNDVKIHLQSYDTNSEGKITDAELWYQKSNSNVVQAGIEKAGTGYICDYTNERDAGENFENCVGIYRGGLGGIYSWHLTYDDFSHYEVLENGNINLTFIINTKELFNSNNEDDYVLVGKYSTFEYSAEGKLLNIKLMSRIVETCGGTPEENKEKEEENTYEINYTYEYGVVDGELLKSWVEVAEAKRTEV